MHLPSAMTPVPRHAKTLGISCQPDTSIINVSANLGMVSWKNGTLKKPRLHWAHPVAGGLHQAGWCWRCSTLACLQISIFSPPDTVFSQYMAGMSGAQAEVPDKVNWIEELGCSSSPWRQVLCWTFVSWIATQMLWSWAFQHFLSSVFLLFKITVSLSTSYELSKHFLKMEEHHLSLPQKSTYQLASSLNKRQLSARYWWQVWVFMALSKEQWCAHFPLVVALRWFGLTLGTWR